MKNWQKSVKHWNFQADGTLAKLPDRWNRSSAKTRDCEMLHVYVQENFPFLACFSKKSKLHCYKSIVEAGMTRKKKIS